MKKSYALPDGGASLVLDVPRFDVEPGEQVALAGTSGCGKTTLLHVIAGILRPDAGRILFDVGPDRAVDGTRVGPASGAAAGGAVDLATLPEAARDLCRAAHMGYVFQSFHLLQGYTALENVLLGMAFGPGPDEAWARELLDRLGLSDRLHHRPRQLSVGQQQRVALARALANRPALVLADEPTGNLDHRHAAEALRLLRELCTEQKAALLLVSHDREILARFPRTEDLTRLNRAALPARDAVGAAR